MRGSQQLSGKRVDGGCQRAEEIWCGSLVRRMLDQPCQEPVLLLHRVQGDPVQTGEYAEGQRPECQEGGDGPGLDSEPDEDGRKNQQPQPNPGKEEPELSGGRRLLKHQVEDVVGGHESRRVEADLGRVDMRVYAQVGRGVAAFVHEAKALLAPKKPVAGELPALPEQDLEPLQNFCAFVLVLGIGQIAALAQPFNLIQAFFSRDVLHRQP